MKIALFVIVLIFLGCSIKTPPNQWQFQSSNAYKNFESYYLEYKLELAAVELDRARSHAKQSADLTTLARIELASCALHVALLEPFTCKNYEALKPLISSDELESYAHFLVGDYTTDEVKKLPKQYQDFAYAKLSGDTESINKAVLSIKPFTSEMIAGSLSQDLLSHESIAKIVDKASYHGYRYAVIVWLRLQIEKSSDPEQQSYLRQKLKVLMP